MIPPFLLPAAHAERSIIERLNQSLERAQAVRGSVAYWTVPPGYLSDNFLRLMRKPDSFCCVDIHWPSNPAVLAQYYALGARSFGLYCKELHQAGALQARQGLMHTKMLVLDMPGGMAEIWIGSHNFTKYALGGTNLEASVLLTYPRDSNMYHQARAYVEAIRAECLPFDPARLADYQALQRGGPQAAESGEVVIVLPLVGYDIMNLRGQTLLLLGDDVRELARFGKAESEKLRVLVRAGDLRTCRTYLFEALIQSSGRIDKLNEVSYGINFTPRPYALRRKRFIPYTAYRNQAFGGDTLKKFAYWANLQLHEIVGDGTELSAVHTPLPAWWVQDQQATRVVRAAVRRAAAEQAARVHTGQQELFSQQAAEQLEELANESGDKPLALPEIRVPRFRNSVADQPERKLRAVESAFEPVTLAAAQAIYEEEFQQQFFGGDEVIMRDTDLALALPDELKAIQQDILLHKRRWHR